MPYNLPGLGQRPHRWHLCVCTLRCGWEVGQKEIVIDMKIYVCVGRAETPLTADCGESCPADHVHGYDLAGSACWPLAPSLLRQSAC